MSLCALQEVNLTDERLDDLRPTIDIAYLAKAKNDNTRGVALAVKNNLHPQRCLELEEPDVDIVWCIVNIGPLKVMVASAYCTPAPSNDSLKKLIGNVKKV